MIVSLVERKHRRKLKMNVILIVAKHMINVAAPDCVGIMLDEGHNFIITGDYGYIGSTVTRKEALDIAYEDAKENGDEVQIEE